MELRKAVGRNSSARKYDLLSVLAAYSLSQEQATQRLTLRFSCLITARYNWQADHLSVPQTEIAKMWSCDPRTVKREMASLRQRSWLVEKQPAARGRAATYSLGMRQILEDTRPAWGNIGQDLIARLSEHDPAHQAQERKVIPFPQTTAPPEGDGLWSHMAQKLCSDDPTIYQAWFAGLTAQEASDRLILRAPNSFQARYIHTNFYDRIARVLNHLAPQISLEIC